MWPVDPQTVYEIHRGAPPPLPVRSEHNIDDLGQFYDFRGASPVDGVLARAPAERPLTPKKHFLRRFRAFFGPWDHPGTFLDES